MNKKKIAPSKSVGTLPSITKKEKPNFWKTEKKKKRERESVGFFWVSGLRKKKKKTMNAFSRTKKKKN